MHLYRLGSRPRLSRAAGGRYIGPSRGAAGAAEASAGRRRRRGVGYARSVLRTALLTVTAALVVVPTASASYGGALLPTGRGGALVYFQWTAGNAYGECSGVLVAPRAVLTAGHCVRTPQFGRHRVREVRIGNNRARTVTKAVTRVRIHPGYDPDEPQRGNDLAVIVLQKAVTSRAPVALGKVADEPPQGAQVEIVGYGVTVAGQLPDRARKPRFVRLEMLSPFNCASWRRRRLRGHPLVRGLADGRHVRGRLGRPRAGATGERPRGRRRHRQLRRRAGAVRELDLRADARVHLPRLGAHGVEALRVGGRARAHRVPERGMSNWRAPSNVRGCRATTGGRRRRALSCPAPSGLHRRVARRSGRRSSR